MPDPASFRLRSVRDEAAMRDAELLPSRVRRSDALQRNRAEEAMIKRSASAGSVLHIAGSGNAEMSRAAAIDARGSAAVSASVCVYH